MKKWARSGSARKDRHDDMPHMVYVWKKLQPLDS